MSELIWISDWQIQCCGDEFAVGDVVTWPVLARDLTSGSWGSVLGEELESSISGNYERHDDDVPDVTGIVRRIRTLSCEYAALPPPHDPRERQPLPGTGLLEDVTAIEKWYGASFDADVISFCGWLVDLEMLS